jgi:choline dehydrogenase-like flavoprotein
VIFSDNLAGELLEADVCICGGGPAAITVALELLPTGASVVVLVGGGANRESASDQDLNRGLIARAGSHEGLEENRRRVFGGATTVWGGRCIPFDPIDFKERSWIPHSGWPITYEQLKPYYARALGLCDAGPDDHDSRCVFPEKTAPIIPGMQDSAELESWKLERWSPPVDFGRKYQDKLAAAQNVRVYLESHILQFASTAQRERIDRGLAISKGRRFEVRAKVFVLATGGIENARILLCSKSELHPHGVGNDADLVGRFYQAHPHGTYASLAPRRRNPVDYNYQRDGEGVYCRRRWSITEETQRRLGIGNAIFFLDHTNPAHGHRDALFSTVFVAKAALGLMRSRTGAGRAQRLRAEWPAIRKHLGTIAADGPGLAPRLTALAKARLAKDRRLPSILPSVNARYLGLYFQAEQIPNRESRITLSPDQLDEHGVPRAVVQLMFSAQDETTVLEAHRIFIGRYLAASAGDLMYDEDGLIEYVRNRFRNFNSAAHHIGTTRMASSPSQGVVDGECKVHGVENLYVAGSSVFATGSHANPTLTLVALAARLGEHLARTLPKR